jgi:glycogen debranching enzyme
MAEAAAAALAPRADGALVGRGDARLALAGPRLLARADAGGVHDATVWGGGRIGGVRFDPVVPERATATILPGRLRFAWDGGEVTIDALQDRPGVAVHARGAGLALVPSDVRTAPAGLRDGPGAARRRCDDGWRVDAPWAAARLWAPGARWDGRALRLPDGEARAWFLAGRDEDEVQAALARLRDHPEAPTRAHEAWIAELLDRFEVDDPTLRTMVVHGLANAFAARKELAGGVFAGHAAGHAYAAPARSYYRDGYWTVQALLPVAPERALEQARLLARGVTPDGRAPSAVVATSAAGMRAWRARRAADPTLAADHPVDDLWWPDHADSPSFFVLLARDALAWARPDPHERAQALHEEVDGVPLLRRIGWAADGIVRRCDARGLPTEPENDRDWADNVVRHGVVGYDVGLAYGALRAAADLSDAGGDPAAAARAAGWRASASRMRDAAMEVLWDDAAGRFREFVRPDGREPGTTAIDTSTLLRFGLADERTARRTLDTFARELETRAWPDGPLHDWGVACLRPTYPAWVPRRGKSRFPHRYHDGAEWPYWSGVYAEQRLRRGLDGWRYPLTRWWEVGLARGLSTPVEYHSPPWPPGSPATGWSSMPTAAVLLGGYGLRPDGRPVRPPWGDSVLRGVRVGGRPADLIVRGHALEVRRHASV